MDGSRLPVLLALSLLAIGGRAAAQEPVTAVWQKHKVVFTYQSSVAIYSCDSLRERVASIFYALGARPDLEVKVASCPLSIIPSDSTGYDAGRRTWEAGTGTDYMAPAARQQGSTIIVRLSMPVEMTPEVVEELKADKSRRELISRVTGNPIPRFDDPVPFAAERRVVTLSNKTIGIEAAECQLLDQLVASAFDDLGLRVVRRRYSCDRHRSSTIDPMVDVEVLVPVTAEPRGGPQAPAEAGDETEPGAPEPPEAGTTEPPAKSRRSNLDVDVAPARCLTRSAAPRQSAVLEARLDGAQDVLAGDHANEALTFHDHESAVRRVGQKHPCHVVDVHGRRHRCEPRGHEIADAPARHIAAAAFGQEPEAIVLRQIADHVPLVVDHRSARDTFVEEAAHRDQNVIVGRQRVRLGVHVHADGGDRERLHIGNLGRVAPRCRDTLRKNAHIGE